MLICCFSLTPSLLLSCVLICMWICLEELSLNFQASYFSIAAGDGGGGGGCNDDGTNVCVEAPKTSRSGCASNDITNDMHTLNKQQFAPDFPSILLNQHSWIHRNVCSVPLWLVLPWRFANHHYPIFVAQCVCLIFRIVNWYSWIG